MIRMFVRMALVLHASWTMTVALFCAGLPLPPPQLRRLLAEVRIHVLLCAALAKNPSAKQIGKLAEPGAAKTNQEEEEA